jgi:hypothetical protein
VSGAVARIIYISAFTPATTANSPEARNSFYLVIMAIHATKDIPSVFILDFKFFAGGMTVATPGIMAIG